MLKVIIADDERLICRLVQALGDWEALDMEVAGLAENGLEALELIERERPDILITDIRMPGCDGLELIRRAKELRPELEIVIISGYAHFEYAQTAIRYGVGNYLLKPIKKDELMETLRKMKERCEERTAGREVGEARYKKSQNDLKRLRNSLIDDLMSAQPPVLTNQILKETYYFDFSEGQAFLVKLDCRAGAFGNSAEVVREKVQEILNAGLKGLCSDVIFCFRGYTGYGLLSCDSDRREQVRKAFRFCLGQLEAGNGMFGPVRFSAALGDWTGEAGHLPASLRGAQDALAERLIEGPGRLFEHVPRASGLPVQEILDRYARDMEHAIETLNVREAAEAVEAMQERALNQEGVCGREIFGLVLSAGRLFIARMVHGDAQKAQREFDQDLYQCADSRELFELLSRRQEELLMVAEGERQNEASRPIRMAKQYVMQHFQDPITLEEVCEAAGFSASYFSSLFKKETGEGFAKYLTRVRMEEAKTLLRETNLPVSEICERVGYSDRKHFTHTFHRATGLNPAEYRKMYG